MSPRCRTRYPRPSRGTQPRSHHSTVPHTLNPIRVGELKLLCIRRAECVRGILQSTKANSFEEESVQRRDWFESDQGKFNPKMSELITSRTMYRVYYRAARRLCLESARPVPAPTLPVSALTRTWAPPILCAL